MYLNTFYLTSKNFAKKSIITHTIIFLIILLILPGSIVFCTVSSYTSTSDLLLFGPYPQYPTSTSITICWETKQITKQCMLYWGETKECSHFKEIPQSDLEPFYAVKISDLRPSTKYYYKISIQDQHTPVYSFETSARKNETITFAVYGDTRGVWDDWRNASFVANAIKQKNPSFIIHTGDIVHDGRNKKEWVDYFTISDLLHNTSLYPAIGNHEKRANYYDTYFLQNISTSWYSFDNGPVHFIALDSEFPYRYNQEQFQFLIRDLLTHEKPYTIIYFHHPPYSAGLHGSTYDIRFLWGVFFELFNVDIVFNGHDHLYEHGKVGSVHYVVAAGGGAPLYPSGNRWWTQYSESVYHFCYLVANQKDLTVHVIDINQETIDSFVIEP